MRFGDFTTVTRSRTLPEPTDLAADLRRVAGELLHALDVAPGVRLLGVSGQQLVRRTPATADQGTLFGEPGDPGVPGPPGDARKARPGQRPRTTAARLRSSGRSTRCGPVSVLVP